MTIKYSTYQMREALIGKLSQYVIGHVSEETCLDFRTHHRHGTRQAVEYQGVANT